MKIETTYNQQEKGSDKSATEVATPTAARKDACEASQRNAREIPDAPRHGESENK